MPFCGPWGGFWVMPLVGFAVLVVLFLVLGARGPLGSFAGRGESPLSILKRRYARGELTREQFEEMRRDVE